MLLIAQPKSASTSLMWTFAHIMKVAHKNGHNRRKGDLPCHGFEELQKYHGTTVKRGYAYLNDYICRQDILYKEHILPTKEHLEFITDINKPVVVLMRDAKETIESYKRVFAVLPEVKIDYDKLYDELQQFQVNYGVAYANNNLYKLIGFNDITNNFTETIKKVIIHYNREVPKDIEKYKLCKRNYTYK